MSGDSLTSPLQLHDGVLERIVSFLREPALICDEDLCVVFWNKAAQSVLGVDGGDEGGDRGKPCMEALGSRGYGKTIERVAGTCLQTGREASATLSVVRSGGGELQWRVRACKLNDGEGSASPLVLVVLNLESLAGGSRSRGFVAEEGNDGIQQSRILLDLLPDIVFEVDDKGNLLYVNGMAIELLGYTPNTFSKLNLRDLLSPTDQMDLDVVLEQMVGGEFIHRNMHYHLICRDGGRIPVEVNAIVIQGPDAKPRILGIARDYTLQHRLEERLRQSEERYRDLFESSRDLIFCMDATGVVLEMNRAGVALRGQPRHQIVGHRFSELLSQSSIEVFFKSLNRTASGEHVDVEVEMVGKKGVVHVLEVALAPIFQEAAVLQIHGTARDVTEKRKLQEQVDQFQRMESLGRLAAGVAHDFNNVLGAVLGLASVLEVQLAEDNRCRADVAGIVQAARKGSELTSQILSFARGGTRKNENVELDRIVDEVVQLLGRIFSSNVSVVVNTTAENPLVRGDSGQLTQVVMNLCMNAYDAIKDGGIIKIGVRKINGLPPSVHLDISQENLMEQSDRDRAPLALSETNDNNDVKTEKFEGGPERLRVRSDQRVQREAESTGVIELSVSDNGSGIQEENRPHIFEPFFTTKSQDKGIGLGLSVCWGIIRDHGGHICVDSSPCEGSTFKVFLPASSMDKIEKKIEQKPSKATIFKGTALVVDDQEPMLRAGRRMLEQAGYRVVCARCWKELEGVLDDFEESPDLTILDLGLPDTDGLTVYREMKRRFGDPYVIAVSGYSYEGAAHQILKEGAKNFIQKPFSWSQLREVLEQL